MWTVDMSRCPGCPDKEECLDRKEMLPLLSGMTHNMNTDSKHVDGPGDGTIIVHCQQNR